MIAVPIPTPCVETRCLIRCDKVGLIQNQDTIGWRVWICPAKLTPQVTDSEYLNGIKL